MGRAKYAKTISAHVPTSLIPSIDALCEKHGVSRSKILGYIVTAWYRAGCPSPTQLDTDFFERALRPRPTTPEPFPSEEEPTNLHIAAETPAPYEPPTPEPTPLPTVDQILADARARKRANRTSS